MAHGALQGTMAMLGLSQRLQSPLDLMPVIRRGLPPGALAAVARRMDMSPLAMAESLGLAKRTLARRIQSGQKLTAEESERVVRLARVLALAADVLGSLEKARHWVQTPNRALGQQAPLGMLDTDVGTAAVLEELGRVDHGVFA